MNGTIESRYEEYEEVSQNTWEEIILGRMCKKHTDPEEGVSWVAKKGIDIGLRS